MVQKSCASWYGKYPIIYKGFIHVGWCRISSINSYYIHGLSNIVVPPKTASQLDTLQNSSKFKLYSSPWGYLRWTFKKMEFHHLVKKAMFCFEPSIYSSTEGRIDVRLLCSKVVADNLATVLWSTKHFHDPWLTRRCYVMFLGLQPIHPREINV